MFDKLKWYLIQVVTQKYLPMGVMAGIAALGSLIAAHAGVLEQYGITYGSWPFAWPAGQEPSGTCILIEMDTLSKGTIVAVAGLVTIAFRAFQHHTTGTVAKPYAAPPEGLI